MKIPRLALILIGSPLLAGCVAARMQIDPALSASAMPQPVEGMALAQFRKPVTFAGYTGKIRFGGFKSSTRVKAGPYERQTSSEPFAFTVTGGSAGEWTGDCTYGTSKQGALFPISDDAGLVCTLIPGAGQGWQMQLTSAGNLNRPNTLTGTLTDGATTFTIAMVHRLENAAFQSAEPVGYEVRDAAGLAVAAVQLFRPNQVWLDPKLPEDQQTGLAVGLFALLVSASATSDINDQGSHGSDRGR